MARREPDPRGRLQIAAMTLFVKKGFDETTVAEIADHAGLTERTFFRYFVDKREVLFSGAGALQEAVVGSVASAADLKAPLEAIASAFEAAMAGYEHRRRGAKQRQVVIAAHAELRERELIKLASLSAAIAEALRRRGISEPAASLAGESGVSVFRIAFDRWVHDKKQRTLSQHLRESLRVQKALT